MLKMYNFNAHAHKQKPLQKYSKAKLEREKYIFKDNEKKKVWQIHEKTFRKYVLEIININFF